MARPTLLAVQHIACGDSVIDRLPFLLFISRA